MDQKLAHITFYAYNGDELDEFEMLIGLPEKPIDVPSTRVVISIRKNETEKVNQSVRGANAWQALVLAFTLLKVRLDLELNDTNKVVYSTREDAVERMQTHGIPMGHIFPQDM
jgi:hypothetical protein